MSKLCFVTTCMGRLEHLKESLPRVVAQPDCSCVVVDYSCPDRCGDWVEATYPQVRVVRIPGQTTFNRSLASNAGARAAEAPWLGFFDADICFEPSFADEVLEKLQPGRYYRPEPVTDAGTVGTFLCEREAFERVGGYDEVYKGWGGRDRDVYWSLQFVGVKPAGFPSSLVRHIPHEDEDRTRFHDVKALSVIGTINGLYRMMKLDMMRVTQRLLLREHRDRLYEQIATTLKRGLHDDDRPMVFSATVPGEVLPGGSSVDRVFQYRLEPPAGRPRDSGLSADASARMLHASLTPEQRRELCFDWDYRCPERGLLRSFLTNHWQITRPAIRSRFFTAAQQQLIHDVFHSLLTPGWYPRFMQQLHEDAHGHPWGDDQSIAFFGSPDAGPFQLVITGRHLTLRADGNPDALSAFGGPIMYGHAAGGFTERAQHAGNVFWPQAERASRVYELLDDDERRLARVAQLPVETELAFKGTGGVFAGIAVSRLGPVPKAAVERMLEGLLEPFRREDQERVRACLQVQGGLEACSLAFYEEGHISGERWDSWRLEGPAFVWYFRGTPHVHVWVHVARDPTAPVNARTGRFLFPGQDPLR